MMHDIFYPLENSGPRIAGMPRRFGIGVLLILMTAFAVLFGILRALGAEPVTFAVVAGLFLGAAVGQAVLFEGKWSVTSSWAASTARRNPQRSNSP